MVSPDTTPPPPPRPDATPAAEAARRRRADRARQAFVAPWSRRRARRVGLVAVALGILGPVVGTAIALLLVPAQPPAIVPLDDDRVAVLDAEGSIRSIDPVAGEMALRLVLKAGPATPNDLFDDAGSLTEDLVLVVNDANGQSTRTLTRDQPPGTLTVTIALTDSRATRYPVDRYRSTVFVVAHPADDPDEAVPLRLSLRSSDPVFKVEVADDAATTDTLGVLELRISRRGTVIGWAGFFVLVCWLLAIAAASLGWTTVVHGIASPGWAWGFLIGVLFALPPLRNALPGAPPSGSLVDLAAFYWAVGIVALTLVAMIGSWNIRVRRAPDEPDSPKPRI
ncbi:MAG TPA: DUF4436 family protein [Iamia sp.]|nr:DUF4436 family protein [Iamia sp.]